jgi:hypothetical protein
MKKIISVGALLAFMPMVTFAVNDANAFDIMATINQILGWLIPILITLAVVYFIWGVIQYTLSSDEEAKKNARSKIIQGLIGLFVIVAFWGIIKIVTNTFGVGPGTTPILPCIPNPAAGVYCD